MNKQYKRRNFFINKSYQGRFMFLFYLLLTFSCLIFSLLLIYLSSDSLTIVYQNNDLRVDRTPFLFLQHFLKAGWFLLIPFGFLVLLLALFKTHRTAGPLFKFEKVVDDMIDGHIGQKVYLRKNDEVKELATKLTLLNTKLAKTMGHLGELSNQLEVLANQENVNEPEHKAEILALSKEISTTVNSYTISDDN